MTSIPPIRTFWSLLGAIALAVALVGCGAPTPTPSAPSSTPAAPPPSLAPSAQPSLARSPAASWGAGGLLVVANGIVQETTDEGSLTAFDAPAERIQAAVAATDRVLVVAVDGRTWVSSGTGTSRSWAAVPASVTAPGVAPLISLSPSGSTLAALRGDPQATRFDLDLIDVPAGTARRVPVPRGLNGPPAWLEPTTVVANVIPAGRSSGLAAIDTATGAVTDSVGPGIELAVSADGRSVALIDQLGDVLVGDASLWRAGTTDGFSRLHDGDAEARSLSGSAEHVALSPDGLRVAIVRRDAVDVAAVEIWLRQDGSWQRSAVLEHLTAGPVSVAWTR